MEYKIDRNIVNINHPELIKKINNKFKSDDLEYKYCLYGNNFTIYEDNNDVKNIEKYIEDIYRECRVFLDIRKENKKLEYLVSDNKNYDEILDYFYSQISADYNSKIETHNIKRTKQQKFDFILKSVGKEGTCVEIPYKHNRSVFDVFNSIFGDNKYPLFPTLSDFENVYPKIYQEYKEINSSKKLVLFEPNVYGENDENGFIVYDVVGAYKPTKKDDKRIRIIFKSGCSYSVILFDEDNKYENNLEYWIFLQDSIIKKFEKAQEGEVFKGWEGAKEYKLTSIELEEIMKNRIFETHLKF